MLCFCPAPASRQDSSSASDSRDAPPHRSCANAESRSAEVAAAEAAIAASDWKTAEAKLDPWLAAHPTDARALFDAGYVADAQNRLDDAAALYRRAIAADPKSFEAHLSLGLLLARQGQTRRSPSRTGGRHQTRSRRGWTRAQSSRLARSGPDRSRLQTPPPPPTTCLKPSSSRRKRPPTRCWPPSWPNRPARSTQPRPPIAACSRKDPESEPANAGLAHLLILRKQYPEAENFLRAALEKLPGRPHPHRATGHRAGRPGQGRGPAAPEKLHAAHPADPAITRMLAEVAADAGDIAGSDQLYVKLLAAAPDDPDLLVAHGQNLVRLGQICRGFCRLRQGTQIDPANADGWSGLAFAASRTSQPAVTLHALTMRSRYLPENASTYFLWATAYDSLHQKAAGRGLLPSLLDAAAGKFPESGVAGSPASANARKEGHRADSSAFHGPISVRASVPFAHFHSAIKIPHLIFLRVVGNAATIFTTSRGSTASRGGSPCGLWFPSPRSSPSACSVRRVALLHPTTTLSRPAEHPGPRSRAEQAQPREQCFLYAELVQQMTELSVRQ